MADYIKFMEDEMNAANQERASYGRISEVEELMKMLEAKSLPSEIESYIISHLNILFSYAPHLTCQVYLALLVAQNKIYEADGKLNALLVNPDLPAKAYSVVKSYIDVMKESKEKTPDLSFSDDRHIQDELKDLNQNSISRLIMAIQTRLQAGTSIDHFVDLLNPYMQDTSKPAMYKLSILNSFVAMSSKFSCTKPFLVNIAGKHYTVLIDGKTDLETDSFLRVLNYYVTSLHLPQDLEGLVRSFAQSYRVLHYNESQVLNTEIDIKSFVASVIDAYNVSARIFYPNKVFAYTTPQEYYSAKGYNEAKAFIADVSTARL